MIITAIRTLLSQAFDAASYLINPVADEVWERACRHADELAEAEAQEWTDGDRCTALAYWRSIAVQLDAAANARGDRRPQQVKRPRAAHTARGQNRKEIP